jgi:hypothetical protein
MRENGSVVTWPSCRREAHIGMSGRLNWHYRLIAATDVAMGSELPVERRLSAPMTDQHEIAATRSASRYSAS